MQHFKEFKLCYKGAANFVQAANLIFAIFLSWIFVSVTVSVIFDGQKFMFALFKEADASDPSNIRCMAGIVIRVLLKFGVIGYTVMQAIATNDEMRNVPVLINDFITADPKFVNDKLYFSVSLLKL